MNIETIPTVQLKELIQEQINMFNAVKKVYNPEDSFYKEREKALQASINELNKRKK